jgi:hypothetical protein
MIPAFVFFVCMCAYAPEIAGGPAVRRAAGQAEPADLPCAVPADGLRGLLESGTGAVHAINERVAHAWQQRRATPPSTGLRAGVALALLVGCMLIADRVGLVTLIASGYRALAYAMIAVYVLPLITLGAWRLWKA